MTCDKSSLEETPNKREIENTSDEEIPDTLNDSCVITFKTSTKAGKMPKNAEREFTVTIVETSF